MCKEKDDMEDGRKELMKATTLQMVTSSSVIMERASTIN
jgi:hypothetical protein